MEVANEKQVQNQCIKAVQKHLQKTMMMHNSDAKI